ncbi:enoyl-ACP reductase FabV [Fangia hongkongensis]|uniref:enoyl-ACP reductase FabV n=1 Tax=Fangia hongkongensis TaxID=270495 RepID=UPI00036FBE4F|nr:enoyl-ACP reductase FabV [Fangia hongkongensis]MBK2125488.1 trans-2-enoyl-CoA reductase family protein [Fangia hongkongensis]
MIIKPQIMRGGLVKNPHPIGLKNVVSKYIDYTKSKGQFTGKKRALIIGGSSGYGLASRIALAYGANADTINVSFENGVTDKRLGSAGWWNNIWFEHFAKQDGLIATDIIGDAFSDEIKQQTIEAIKREFGGKIDVLIYSLASPKRKDPKTGIVHSSVLKSTTGEVAAPTLDLAKERIVDGKMLEATKDDIDETIKVMGGEDWQLWVEALQEADLLAEGFKSTAYSYDGAKATDLIYKKGTIGAAKRHLEKTAHELNDALKNIQGEAFVTVAKALVTKASAFIPLFPLYGCALFKVMKEEGTHENTIEQIERFMRDMMYGDKRIVDEVGRVRPDNLEMNPATQQKVDAIMEIMDNDNFKGISDFAGFYQDFLEINGFNVEGVDYDKSIDVEYLSSLALNA